VVRRTFTRPGKQTAFIAAIELRRVEKEFEVTSGFLANHPTGRLGADPYDLDQPRDFVPQTSAKRSALLAVAALAALPIAALDLLLAAVRTVGLGIAWQRRRRKKRPVKDVPLHRAEPALAPITRTIAATPPLPEPPLEQSPIPPPDPTIPAWVMIAGQALADHQRRYQGAASDWVSQALVARQPALQGREYGDCILVKFGSLGPSEVAVVVERIAPDRQVHFETFRRMSRDEFECFGARLR
jgi:hypothetical protein